MTFSRILIGPVIQFFTFSLRKLKCQVTPDGGSAEQCHQMPHGGERVSKIGQKIVTDYLNGPLLNSAENNLEVNLTFLMDHRKELSTPLVYPLSFSYCILQ